MTAVISEASHGPTGSGPTARDMVRAWWPWVTVLVVVLAGAAIVGNPKSQGPPLDPSGTSSQGAKALRLLVAQEGANVAVTAAVPQPPAADVVLILHDQLDGPSRAELVSWVKAGGILVVADPASELAGAAPAVAPGAGGLLTVTGPIAPDCSEPALAGVNQIDPAGSHVFRVPAGTEGCFGSGDTAFLVVRALGAGTVVSMGGPAPWINSELTKQDNAVLAADLLVPRAGTRLTWLNGTAEGAGRRSLIDLVPGRVEEALAQLLVAFVVLALWRGRRLGRPVLERQPVALPGSELVVAVGNLLHQGHRIDQATGILRADLARRLADRLGISPAAPAQILAEATAARTGADPGRILATLAGPPPADEAGLMALARAADAIRQEVAHVN